MLCLIIINITMGKNVHIKKKVASHCQMVYGNYTLFKINICYLFYALCLLYIICIMIIIYYMFFLLLLLGILFQITKLHGKLN